MLVATLKILNAAISKVPLSPLYGWPSAMYVSCGNLISGLPTVVPKGARFASRRRTYNVESISIRHYALLALGETRRCMHAIGYVEEASIVFIGGCMTYRRAPMNT